MKKLPEINIENYESWFLLFADGELNDLHRDAVTRFIRAYPHLKEEFDLLLKTVNVKEESVVLKDKTQLFKISDETLMLYLDNELPAAEREWIEAFMTADWQKRMADLKKAYATPDANIIFPHKEKLYRHSKVAKRSFIWLKVAAAAVLTGLVLMVYFSVTPGKNADTGIATAPVEKIRPGNNTGAVPKLDTLAAPSLTAKTKPEIKNVPAGDRKNITPAISEIQSGPAVAETSDALIAEPRKNKTAIAANSQKIVQELPVNPVIITNDKKTPIAPQAAVKDSGDGLLPVTGQQEMAAAKKRKSFLKSIGRAVKDRALDILTNGDEDITVAGFAVNVHQ